jgi:hypothetical protein
MLEPNLITLFTQPFDDHKIEYMITGSVAAIVYGEPRLTHDVDLVVALHESHLDALLASFPLEQFYAPPRETLQLELQRGARAHFNLIHHASGFKADCYLSGNDPLHHWGMAHRRKIDLTPQTAIWIAPPEYVIIRKLEYYREGESAKHLDDLRRMLPQLEDMDVDWLTQQLEHRGLTQLWETVTI